jgi:hypothetical protein
MLLTRVAHSCFSRPRLALRPAYSEPGDFMVLPAWAQSNDLLFARSALNDSMCNDGASEGVPLTYIEQEIELQTETAFGAEVPISISSALLRHLNDTARPCVRMAIEGTSSPVGAPPQWLERASDIRTLGFVPRDGHSVLRVTAPRLADAAPEVFDQQLLWPGIANPEDTAIQLIGKIGDAVRRQEAASDLYDQPLLRHFSFWQKLFSRRVSGVQLPGTSADIPRWISESSKTRVC